MKNVSGARPAWFLNRDDSLALLDEELVETLRDETARAVVREVGRLPEKDRGLVLRIVRQIGEERDASDGP